MRSTVVVYTKDVCPFCVRAKALLEKKKIPYTDINVTEDTEKRAWLVQATGGRKTLPQIFFGEEPIGGCDDLYALEAQGLLEQALASATGGSPQH